jgi:hypothetical protein
MARDSDDDIVVAVGRCGEIYEEGNSATTKMQFIGTPHGDELAVLPGEEFERLTALAAEAEEHVGTRRLVARARRALDERREVAIPRPLPSASLLARILSSLFVTGDG